MPLMRNDLDRRFLLDVTADGAVFIRERVSTLTRGGLPTFSTETYEQAEMLQARFCRRANDGSGIYRLNETPADLDALGDVSDMFRVHYEMLLARKGEKVVR